MEHFVERVSCPVCGDLVYEVLRTLPYNAPEVWTFVETYYGGRITRADVDGAIFEIRLCRACHFLWQAYHLDDRGMLRLYEEWISAEDSLTKKTRAEVSLYEGYAREVASIAHRLGRKPCEISVLDFGMGWGAWCRMAQAFGYVVSGFELSRRRRDYASERGTAVVESFDALGRYDFINCHQALEHIPDPKETLGKLVGALETGGLMRLSVPNGAAMEQALRAPEWRAAKDALHPLEHLNCFTADTLERLAERAGLCLAPELPAPQPQTRRLAHRLWSALRPKAPSPRGTTQYFARASERSRRRVRHSR